MNNPIIRFKKVDGSDFSDWKESSFQEIFEFRSSISLSRSQLNYTTGEIKNIHYGDILLKFPSIVHTDNKLIPYINQDCIPNKYDLLEKGDVVFADTAEDYSLGKAIEIGSTPFRITSGLHTIACKAKLKFASGFLVYYLNSNFYHCQINKLATGTKVYSIIKSNIIKTKLRTPSSLEEQQKIASFFSTLDQKIELNERKLEVLEKLKKGMMQKIFNRKIRFKKDNGTDFPDWTVSELGNIAEIRGGGTPSTSNRDYWDGNIQWLTPTEIDSKYVHESNRKITESGLANSSAKLLPMGAILLTTRATIGACSINNFNGSVCTNQGFQSLVCKTSVLNEYVYYAITFDEFQKKIAKHASGSTFLEISAKNLKKLTIPTPSLEEQRKIADFLSTLDLQIDIKKKTVSAIRDLKRGFMQQMFV